MGKKIAIFHKIVRCDMFLIVNAGKKKCTFLEFLCEIPRDVPFLFISKGIITILINRII